MATGTWQQATKEMPCKSCGELMTVTIRTRLQPQHVECGVQNAVEAARQMRDKSGPYYEKWLARRWPAGDPRWGGTPNNVRRRRGSAETRRPASSP